MAYNDIDPNFLNDFLGQVPGNPQPQTDWMWGNHNVPQNPYGFPENRQEKTYGSDYEAYLKGEGLNNNIDAQGNLRYSPYSQHGNLRDGQGGMEGYKLSVEDLMKQGYNKEEATQIFNSETQGMGSREVQGTQQGNWMNNLPFMTSTGSDIGTELFMAGRALGTDKGTPGRGLAIAGGIGSAILGGARAGLSGYALSKANETQEEWQRKQLAKGRAGSYTPAPQYQNTNTLGGASAKYGGLFKNEKFADGGTMPPDGAPTTTPFNLADRSTWSGTYLNFPETGNLSDPLPALGSGWEASFPTWGDYISARETEMKDPTVTNPLVGMYKPTSFGEMKASAPVATTPKVTQGYLVIDPGSKESRRVDAEEYRKFQGKKTTMPVDSRGHLVRAGGATFTDYSNYSDKIDLTSFEDGGEQMMSQQEQGMPQEQGGGEQEQMQQIAMAAQQMMEQGASPEEAVQALISNGVPQELAQQVVQMIMQQGQQQQQMPQEQPQMAYGGLFQDTNSDPVVNFNKNVGDHIKFTAAGKKYEGKIKKIENGKFYI